MTCPKCGAKLQETSLVCLNCKTFVLPNIPRKAEAAEPVVPEAKPGTDVFKNLMNFVQTETASPETANLSEHDEDHQPRENGPAQSAGPDINLRQFGSKEPAQVQPVRKPRIQRFGSEDVEVAEESAPVVESMANDIDQYQSDVNAPDTHHAEPSQIRNRRLFIGGVSAIAFIALAIVYYFFFYAQP